MKLLSLSCTNCKGDVYRNKGRINEAKKFGWKTYCSSECQSKYKNKQKVLGCSNAQCHNVFKRKTKQIRSSNLFYCSRSCAAHINNLKFPKRKKVIVKMMCRYCGEKFIPKENTIYCSKKCQYKGQIITKKEICKQIRKLYNRCKRIPLKREFAHYKAARNRFGTWNKAIEAAGFKPNPVMFAKKYLADDGHKCDSLAEKIIDDWLSSKKIKHKREISYPEHKSLTVDFLIGNTWVEFFGLSGVLKKYDRLVKKKRILCKKYNLHLIEIYPKDLFPANNLSKLIKTYLPNL